MPQPIDRDANPIARTAFIAWLARGDAHNREDLDDSPRWFASDDPVAEAVQVPGSMVSDPATGNVWVANASGVLEKRIVPDGDTSAAGLIGILDTGAFYVGATVELALAEIDAALGGTNSTTRNYSSNGYVADNDDIVVAVGKLDAPLTAYRDQFVQATMTVPNTGGGGTAAALTMNLIRAVDGTDPATICQVLIIASAVQYEPYAAPIATITFSAATIGTIVASGNGWALVATNATGDFACTVSDSADETVYFRAITAEAISDFGQRCAVVASNSDAAAWSA